MQPGDILLIQFTHNDTSDLVSVRQARGLPVVSLLPHPASFRFHLTMDTLAFGCTLPATGRVRDFHPLETCAAGRTKRTAPRIPKSVGRLCIQAQVLFCSLGSSLSRSQSPIREICRIRMTITMEGRMASHQLLSI